MPLIILVLTLLALALAAGAQPPRVFDPNDREIVDAFLQETAMVPAQFSAEECARLADEDADETEAVTWQAMPYLRMPLTAYQLTGDRKYLDLFVQAFDSLRSALSVGPDGFLGWYGKTDPDYRDPDDPDRKNDAIISSFSTAETVCDFLSLISQDTELSRKYAQQRTQYLDLVENQLVKKHEARGDFVDLGSEGAVYRSPPRALKPDSARLTLPHNKHSIILRGLLALYRVTGKDEYMRKAVQIGTRFKHCLVLKDGHYEWNYWDPAGEWDVSPRDHDRWKHWMGPEHRGGYYALSVAQAVALYEYGLVFDRTDIDRFLKTQLERCWNGDMVNPQWSRVDGTRPPEYTQGAYIATALAPFSDKVAAFLFTGDRQEERRKSIGDSWQGGPVTGGWLHAKLVDFPARKGEQQRYLDYGRKFLAKPSTRPAGKPENRRLVEELTLAVTPPGYRPPTSPAQMRPMPPEPEPR